MVLLGHHLNTLPDPETATTTHNIDVKWAQADDHHPVRQTGGRARDDGGPEDQDTLHVIAYRLLEELDLGSDLEGGYAVGRINFIDGPIPGSDYMGAHTDDPITLSLLQKRLIELNTGIRISVLDRL